MKVVFSRKGVDSDAGRCASPIVDGRPYSLPIPVRRTPSVTRYGDLAGLLPALAVDLITLPGNGGSCSPQTLCHLDPDIDAGSLPERPVGWRGALGQAGSALSHLRNQHVGAGDLFLFWGLFRGCAKGPLRWRYVGPPVHVIFGWLEVDHVIDLGPDGSQALIEYPWLERHPHVRPGWTERNAIYIASDRLRFGDGDAKGWGVFPSPIPLTAPDATYPSHWSVPAWLDLTTGGVGMSFHPPHRWIGGGQLKTTGRGQEFVANIGEREDAQSWLCDLWRSVD